jgi:hypothetical protein
LSAYPAWLQAAAWRIANPLSNAIVPSERFQWGPEPEDNALWDFDVNEAVRYFNRYDPVCQASPDWDACANDIGMAFVRKYPLQYLVQSVFEVVKLNFAPFPSPAGSVHNITVWLALLSGAVFGLRRRFNRLHGVVLLALGVYVGSAVLVDTQTRYSVPILPVYAVFATAAPAALLESLARGGARLMRRLVRPGAAPAARPTAAET